MRTGTCLSPGRRASINREKALWYFVFLTRLYICAVFLNEFLGSASSYAVTISIECLKVWSLWHVSIHWKRHGTWARGALVFFLLLLSLVDMFQVTGYLSRRYAENTKVSYVSSKAIAQIEKEDTLVRTQITEDKKAILDLPDDWTTEKKRLRERVRLNQDELINLGRKKITEKVASVERVFGLKADDFALIIILLFDVLIEIMFVALTVSLSNKRPKKEHENVQRKPTTEEGLFFESFQEKYGLSAEALQSLTGKANLDTVTRWLKDNDTFPKREVKILKKIMKED